MVAQFQPLELNVAGADTPVGKAIVVLVGWPMSVGPVPELLTVTVMLLGAATANAGLG